MPPILQRQMDLARILASLREESRRVTEAIAALERLSQDYTPRRGRPIGSKNVAKADGKEIANPKLPKKGQ